MNLSHAELHALVTPVLERYGLRATEISVLAGGLINFTLRIETTAQEVLVLQRLHPVFEAAVNDNLDLVTRALRARGAIAPTLVRTLDGDSAVTLDTAVWRLQTFMPGHSVQQLSATSQAHAAGDLLGRFHATLADWTLPLPHVRPPVHEPARHLAALSAALAAHPGHRLAAEVGAIADQILSRLSQLPPWPAQPLRLLHGDPKISNLLFDAEGRGLCLVDLDTLAQGPLVPELGDAFRSWCNPGPEDAPQADFSLDLFAAAIEGYAASTRGFITRAEWQGIVTGTETIYLELAARFAADALNEAYFGWSPDRFATRGAHNLARARNQLAAGQALARQASAANAMVAAQFS
jgi:Ser/Thr protein kinase RdoA (MazF antagonist)